MATGRRAARGIRAILPILALAILLAGRPAVADYPPPECDDPCAAGCPGENSPCCEADCSTTGVCDEACCNHGGAPRGWHTGMPVGPYSTVNLQNGNLFTVLPVVALSGRGPSLAVALFHNSELVDSPVEDGSGLELGPGWSISYSSRIDETCATPDVVVIEDDGTRNVFTATTNGYEAPPGVHDELEFTTGVGWKLTRPDQTWRDFDTNGLLLHEVDASGNVLTVNRDAAAGYITSIVDAGNRVIEYESAQSGSTRLLKRILDDPDDPTPDPDRDARWWFINSNGTSVEEVILADATSSAISVIALDYDSNGRIAHVTEPDNNTWNYTYWEWGPLEEVRDPVPLHAQTQGFAYTTLATPGYARTDHVDRRGHTWRFTFYQGALTTTSNPLSQNSIYWRDSDYNVTYYRDPLMHYWEYTYDDDGNMLTAEDPLGYVTSRTYDAFNNLKSVTDANSNSWLFSYEDANDPTLLTSIVEPDDGEGNGTATTTLVYYNTNGDDGESQGSLQYVTDPNGVITYFEYDQWGQLTDEIEGVELSGGLRDIAVYPLMGGVDIWTKPNSGGYPLSSSGLGGLGGYGTVDYNALGLVCGTHCYVQVEKGLQSSGGRAVPAGWRPDVPCDFMGHVGGELINPVYTAAGRFKELPLDINYSWGGNWRRRTFTQNYDALGRPTESSVTTNETGTQVHTRSTTYERNDTDGWFRVKTGTGSVEVTLDSVEVTLDSAGQVETVVGTNGVAAAYVWRDDGRVDYVLYGNGTRTDYAYYNNGWLQSVLHTRNSVVFEGAGYTYDPAGRVTQRDEYRDGAVVAEVEYTYDHRNRLIREVRLATDGSPDYDIAYTYDNGGNRLSKTVALAERDPVVTTYHYDTDTGVDGPAVYGSKNNRLMSYVTSNGVDREEVWYVYNNVGNVYRIIRELNGSGVYQSQRFEYDGRGQLWRVLADTWQEDDVFNWYEFGQWWQVALTRDTYTLGEARAFAASTADSNGFLAGTPDEDDLAWLVDTFRPADGQEVRYWLGARQEHEEVYPCDEPDAAPWSCWNWEVPLEGIGNPIPIFCWVPDDACAGPPDCPCWDCPTTGWLLTEPDDGNTNCDEAKQEEGLVLVLNEGDDPNSNGFADVDSNGEYRALIMRPGCYYDTLGGYQPPGYGRLWAVEFRYDAPRQRYYMARLDPDTLQLPAGVAPTLTAYVGDEPVDDYGLVSSNGQYLADPTKRYVFGMSEEDVGSNAVAYVHGDMLGTAIGMSVADEGNPPTAVIARRAVYTSFGELIELAGDPGGVGQPDWSASPWATRYGYAGGWGYQAQDVGSCGMVGTNGIFGDLDTNGQSTNGLALWAECPVPGPGWSEDGIADSLLTASALSGFPFLHLGHRYYDPATGRFLQRDPIGIGGGLNVYAYVGSSPANAVDPSGLRVWIEIAKTERRNIRTSRQYYYTDASGLSGWLGTAEVWELRVTYDDGQKQMLGWVGWGAGAVTVVGMFCGGPIGAAVGHTAFYFALGVGAAANLAQPATLQQQWVFAGTEVVVIPAGNTSPPAPEP